MVRLVMDLRDCPNDGMASASSSSLLLLDGGLIPLRWLSLQRSRCCLSSWESHFPQTKRSSHVPEYSTSYVVHVPSTEVVSVTPSYVSNTARGSDRDDDRQVRNFVPTEYEMNHNAGGDCHGAPQIV